MTGTRICEKERAVAPLIGSILLLAIVITGFAIYQVEVVPQNNFQEEFEHSQDVQHEVVELRDVLHQRGMSQTSGSIPITLGTRYNSGMFTLTPPSPSGTISTTDPPGNISVVIDEDHQNSTEFETTFLQYDPAYREFTTAPTTTIEHTLVYNTKDRSTNPAVIGEQQLIENHSLVVPIVQGEISKSNINAVSVRVTALEREVGNEFDTVNVTLPTNEPDTWVDQLEESDLDDLEVVDKTDTTVTFKANASSVTAYRIEVADQPLGETRPSLREIFFDKPEDDDPIEEPVRCEDGDCDPTEHDEVNGENFDNETLIIPEDEDFVPENDPDGDDQNDPVEYTFASYDINGSVRTNEELSFTSTEGDIKIGEEGSTISGKQFDFDSAADIIIDGAELRTSGDQPGGGNEQITLTANGDISAVNATLSAGNDITLIAEGAIDVSDALFQEEDNAIGSGVNVCLEAEEIIDDGTEYDVDGDVSVGNCN